MRAPPIPTDRTTRAVFVATPDSRPRKFRAVRSAVRDPARRALDAQHGTTLAPLALGPEAGDARVGVEAQEDRLGDLQAGDHPRRLLRDRRDATGCGVDGGFGGRVTVADVLGERAVDQIGLGRRRHADADSSRLGRGDQNMLVGGTAAALAGSAPPGRIGGLCARLRDRPCGDELPAGEGAAPAARSFGSRCHPQRRKRSSPRGGDEQIVPHRHDLDGTPPRHTIADDRTRSNRGAISPVDQADRSRCWGWCPQPPPAPSQPAVRPTTRTRNARREGRPMRPGGAQPERPAQDAARRRPSRTTRATSRCPPARSGRSRRGRRPGPRSRCPLRGRCGGP